MNTSTVPPEVQMQMEAECLLASKYLLRSIIRDVERVFGTQNSYPVAISVTKTLMEVERMARLVNTERGQ